MLKHYHNHYYNLWEITQFKPSHFFSEEGPQDLSVTGKDVPKMEIDQDETKVIVSENTGMYLYINFFCYAFEILILICSWIHFIKDCVRVPTIVSINDSAGSSSSQSEAQQESRPLVIVRAGPRCSNAVSCCLKMSIA